MRRSSVSPPPPGAKGKMIFVKGPDCARTRLAVAASDSPTHPTSKFRRCNSLSSREIFKALLQTLAVVEMLNGRAKGTRKTPSRVRDQGIRGAAICLTRDRRHPATTINCKRSALTGEFFNDRISFSNHHRQTDRSNGLAIHDYSA